MEGAGIVASHHRRPAVDVFIHSDRADWAPPPNRSGYDAHAFWSGSMQDLSAVRRRYDCCWRAPSNVDATFKYDALLEVSRSARASRTGWLGVLADSDVLFQCSARELRSRFRRFGTQIVVSGERRWYPLPRQYPDPFGPVNMSWKAAFTLRHRHQFYPNSGLILGTSAGFETLAAAVRASPRFPCCAFEGDSNGWALDACSSCRPIRRFPQPVSCAVEDQACLQVALASRHHAPPHAVDVNASVFLSLNELTPNDLALKDGQLVFRHTGEVPCVLHSNGHKGILAYLEPHLKGQFMWAVTPQTIHRKGRQRRELERETWLNGAWRRGFRLAELRAS